MADWGRGCRLHRTLRHRAIPVATFINKCRRLGELVTYVYPDGHHPDLAPAVVDADTDEECGCG